MSLKRDIKNIETEMPNHLNPVAGRGQGLDVFDQLNALYRGFGQLEVNETVSLGLAACVAVHHGRRDLAAGGECSS